MSIDLLNNYKKMQNQTIKESVNPNINKKNNNLSNNQLKNQILQHIRNANIEIQKAYDLINKL